MSAPKPRHLQADYAAQFADASVVAAYAARLPYPESVFDRLHALACPGDGRALDLGAGTGDVTFRLAERMAGGVDAVEPSPAMVEAAQLRVFESTGCNSIRWFTTTAESFRERMHPARAAAFDTAVEALVRSHTTDNRVSGTLRSTVIWGMPLAR